MKQNIVIVSILVIAVVVVVGVRNRKAASKPTVAREQPVSTNKPTESASHQNPLPKLLDLGAGKCIPCKMMTPILDEMKETYAGQLDVEFIDVREHPAQGETYRIRSIPTQIFCAPDGKELFRHEGFFPRADILAKWKELGYDLTGEPRKKK